MDHVEDVKLPTLEDYKTIKGRATKFAVKLKILLQKLRARRTGFGLLPSQRAKIDTQIEEMERKLTDAERLTDESGALEESMKYSTGFELSRLISRRNEIDRELKAMGAKYRGRRK